MNEGEKIDRVNTGQTRTTMDQTQRDFQNSCFPQQRSLIKGNEPEKEKFITQKAKKFKQGSQKINTRYEEQNLIREIREESGSSSENKKLQQYQDQKESNKVQQQQLIQYQESVQFGAAEDNYCESPLVKEKKKTTQGLHQPIENFNPFAKCEFLQLFNLTSKPFIIKTSSKSLCACFASKKETTYEYSKSNLIKQGQQVFSKDIESHCQLVFNIYSKLYDTEYLSLYQSEIIVKHKPNIFLLLQISSCIDNFKDDMLLISNNDIHLLIHIMIAIGTYIFEVLKSGKIDQIFKANGDNSNTIHNTLSAIQMGAFYYIITSKINYQEEDSVIRQLSNKNVLQYLEMWKQYKKGR